MKNIRNKFGKMDAKLGEFVLIVNNINTQVKHGKANEIWKRESLKGAEDKLRKELSEVKRNLQMELLKENARGNDLVKSSSNYQARIYNAQMAELLSKGKNSEEVINIYKNLDRDQLEYRQEYEKVFGSKIDMDYSLQWHDAVDQSLTHEEREQRKVWQEVKLMEDYLPTMDTVLDGLIGDAVKGHDISSDVNLVSVFDEVKAQVDHRMQSPADKVRVASENLAREVEPSDSGEAVISDTEI